MEERREVVKQLYMNFADLPDKEQAWIHLIRLTSDADRNVRRGPTYALGSALSHMPDKKQAWEDLHSLTSDIHRDVRGVAADAIGSAFQKQKNYYR